MPTDSKAYQLARQAQELFEAADAENRPLDPDERELAESLVERARQHGAHEKALGGASGDGLAELFAASGQVNTPGGALTPGERFAASAGFKSISDPATRSRQFSTGVIEVSDGPLIGAKGTLLEGAGAPGAGSGGGLIPVPQVAPGIVTKLFQPLTFEQLLSASVATSSTVRYVSEGTATSAASGVAEGGTKPESTLGLGTTDEFVKKVATTLTVSDEILEDSVAVSSFVSGRLQLFVQFEVERQLFRGAQGGNEVQGILTNRSVPVYAGGTAAGNYAEQLFKALNGTRGSSFTEPDWIIMHPQDYQVLRLLKDNQNQYYGGGPFLGTYGGPAQVGSSGQVTGATDLLWNKPVIVTAAMGGAGTALVGNSQAAAVWSRGGLTVEMTNSHSTYFVQDLVAVQAERRLALAVYRPSSFCEVHLS